MGDIPFFAVNCQEWTVSSYFFYCNTDWNKTQTDIRKTFEYLFDKAIDKHLFGDYNRNMLGTHVLIGGKTDEKEEKTEEA